MWFEILTVYVTLVVVEAVLVIVGVTLVPPTVTVELEVVSVDELVFNLISSVPVTVIVYDWSSGLYFPVAFPHSGGFISAFMVYVAPFVSLLPEVSTKAPGFITIFISPPVKF